MKVIGIGINSGEYIAVVTHEELEKLTNNYYGKLQKLAVGSELDLGMGYNYAASINAACKAMEEANKQFGRNQSTLLAFAQMIGDKEPK